MKHHNKNGTLLIIAAMISFSVYAQPELQTQTRKDTSTVVVYSPHDAEPLNAGIIAFMKKYPQIKVKLVAGGTGELCERIATESSNPQADVFWGGGADSMAAYQQYFETFICENDSFIAASVKDDNGKWIGESPLPMVIIYNKKALKEAGIPFPTNWNDCLNPKLKGKIAYCQPAKSGSAYTQLCTMILAHGGKEKGWEFVEKFVHNLNHTILDSSGKCHKLVASGAYYIGITIEKSAALYKSDPNIGFCYPSDGTSAVPDAVSIIKNCPHLQNAQIFVNFVTSYESQKEQCDNWKRRPARNDIIPPSGLPLLKDINLVDYDFKWAAEMKEKNINRFNSIMKIDN